MEPREIVRDALTRWVQTSPSLVLRLEGAEVSLLQQINLGFSPDWWIRCDTLKARRRAERLRAGEQDESIRVSDELEAATMRRLTAGVELA